MKYRIRSVEPVGPAVVKVCFSDGVCGDYDLSSLTAAESEFLLPLRDETFFRAVAVADGGAAFGWRLDRVGEEIDICADAARISIETEAVERLGAAWRDRLRAAE